MEQGLIGKQRTPCRGSSRAWMSRWRGKKTYVETTLPQAVLADGDDAGLTPVDATVVPAAVGALVPKRAV